MSLDFIVRVAQLDPRDLPLDPDDADDDDDEDAAVARVAAFQARYHTTDEALRLNMPNRAASVLIAALREAGAAFRAPAERRIGHPLDGAAGPRGPRGEVPTYKLGSSDGWHVTREEAAVLHESLAAALARGLVVEARGYRYDLRADAPDADDRSTFEWLLQLCVFFEAATRHHGFEVW